MKRLCKETLEALTRNYWVASTALLGRGSGITSKAAIGHLIELSQDRDYARLRCAAAGRLASLGLSDLVHAQEGTPNVEPGSIALGRMPSGDSGCLAVRDDVAKEEKRGICQLRDLRIPLLPPPVSLVLEGAP